MRRCPGEVFPVEAGDAGPELFALLLVLLVLLALLERAACARRSALAEGDSAEIARVWPEGLAGTSSVGSLAEVGMLVEDLWRCGLTPSNAGVLCAYAFNESAGGCAAAADAGVAVLFVAIESA